MEDPRSNPGTITNDTPGSEDRSTEPTTTERTSTVATLTRLGVSRRSVVLGASVVGAAGVLSACGGSSGGTTAADPAASDSSSSSASASSDDNGGDSGGSGSEKLASKSDVPVGGGSINKNAKVVVTQPTSGTFKAFTAVCTHMSCLVATVQDNVITCPCHGSQYSATDGSVEGGPAPKPLAAVAITVDGDDIVQA